MDPFIIVATVIAIVISVLVDIYLIIIYTHKDQPNCSVVSMFCRILILLSLLQAQIQPIFLIFDALISQTGGPELSVLWIIVYFSILAVIAFLKPLGTSLYESDEDDPCWKRILWTLVQVFITMTVFGVFLGVGWLFWGSVSLPVTEISVSDIFQNQQIVQTITEGSIELPITFPYFLIGTLCLIGYPILACCGACGMAALPISMIIDFKNRPKWRRTNEARTITEEIKRQTVELITQADKVRRALNRVQYIDGWFAKRKKNQQLESMLSDLENKTQRHRNIYQLFRLELNMAETNPIIFILKLIGGIFLLTVLVPLWWVQMQDI